MDDVIKIDVWSDVACPWCYIGKRRLEVGLAAFAEDPAALPVTVEYHSFELAPDTPVDFDGGEVDFLTRHKGLSDDQARELIDRVAEVARSVGLEYRFDILRHTSTVKAHQLLHYARARGVQAEAKERLLRAYFAEGRHIGHDDELADLAAEIGLDRDDVLRSLAADEYLGAVRDDQRQAVRYGIGGVPFYVLDGRYGISGAQPSEVFAQGLSQVAAEREG